ncbi:MAG: outer membrane beta-barrel protein [Polyangia bacterium]
MRNSRSQRRAEREGRALRGGPLRSLSLPGLCLLLGLLSVLSPHRASAQEPPPAGWEPARKIDLVEQNERLTRELAKLREEVAALREDHGFLSQQVANLLPLGSRFSGYLDFGFFYVGGDGTGLRNDIGYSNFPEYRDVVPDSWVFMGDPLATAINSRGDPANTGESRAVTFNPIGGGKPSFILNNVNLAVFAGLTENLQVNALIDFVPRGRSVSNPNGQFLGDYIDVKLAYAEYSVPLQRIRLSLSAGKFDSVLGYEYRIQESPDRITVTPSLICRYTCGRPLGLKARLRTLDNRFTLSLALTNGSNFIEQFPIYDETDSNYFKTGTGRIGYKFPVGAGLEIGASGALGVQDQQTDNGVLQWHYGFDLHLDVRGFELAAEFVQGRASGKSSSDSVRCDEAQCLDYKGAYGLVAYRVTNWLMPYVRTDWREALHESGASFVYISDVVRITGGLRLELGTHVIVKAEYTHLREIGRVPEFPDDVLTSSLVIKY